MSKKKLKKILENQEFIIENQRLLNNKLDALLNNGGVQTTSIGGGGIKPPKDPEIGG